jgi:hypothetical protein
VRQMILVDCRLSTMFWGRGDVGTWGRGDVGTWGRGDVGTWGRGR